MKERKSKQPTRQRERERQREVGRVVASLSVWLDRAISYNMHKTGEDKTTHSRTGLQTTEQNRTGQDKTGRRRRGQERRIGGRRVEEEEEGITETQASTILSYVSEHVRHDGQYVQIYLRFWDLYVTRHGLSWGNGPYPVCLGVMGPIRSVLG